MSEYISVLLTVQNLASKHISKELSTIVENSERALILQSILLVLVIAGTQVMCFAVARLTSSIQSFARRLSVRTKQLDEEKDRAVTLLYQMFPKSVAEQLKRGKIVRAEHFESVTVFFSDIVNFTSICSSVTPMEVTLMLNTVYGIFDELTESMTCTRWRQLEMPTWLSAAYPDRMETNTWFRYASWPLTSWAPLGA